MSIKLRCLGKERVLSSIVKKHELESLKNIFNSQYDSYDILLLDTDLSQMALVIKEAVLYRTFQPHF